ncbi:PilC/PilY family type IV pilus protein [Microbulbifer taiwanensis]|nr:PilC/PilY family type IV pilus protein [Microbulbifer taiwanensis]
MLVMDSSGSMENVVPGPLGYDKNEVYASCENPIGYKYEEPQDPGDFEKSEVRFRVTLSESAAGTVEFTIGDGIWRSWDTKNNCFDDAVYYDEAWLYADRDNGFYFETGNDKKYRSKNVSGHFLNWFFSHRDSSDDYRSAKFLNENGSVRRSKVGVRRVDIMKEVLHELISNLSGTRVGLMQFDGKKDGGRAMFGVSELTPENRNLLHERVDAVDTSSSTPLAETFAGVARYFISGYEDQHLSYIDEDGSTVSAPGREIFDNEPDWDEVSPKVKKPDNTINGGAIQYHCQKNFMVALTDGEPSYRDDEISSHLKGYDFACSGNPAGCTDENQGYSSDRGEKIHEMDDVVKALFDIDLRPDLRKPDGTPVKHNITSFMIGFAEPGLSQTPLMINAGALGGGGLYEAQDASDLTGVFNRISNSVHEIVGSSSALAFNSSSLDAGSVVFKAKFNSSNWSGELSALELDDSGEISSAPAWEASVLLDSGNPDNRVMLTYREGTGGVAFTSLGVGLSESLSAHAQDLSVNTSSGSPVVDSRATERLEYLRGDRSKEGTASDTYRKRDSRLGDIVNSSPVYVGAPSNSWPDRVPFPTGADSYSKFKAQKSGRTPVVYIGANDGFLHGFNARTSSSDAGRELIAYLPSAVLSTDQEYGLHALSSQEYNHKYYVDGTPTVSDVYINGSWKTVLVGGLGGGGKGFFALDVTEPESFRETNASNLVLWEFNSTKDRNMGYSYSRPQIAMMSNGEWAAIFGNGFNSETGDAGIFIVYLDGDGGAGKSYTYLSTGTADSEVRNGMSTPAIVDINNDGVVDRIYAGDLKGNLWLFDVSTVGSWNVASDPLGAPVPLVSVGEAEPITAAPLVLRNTANPTGSAPNLLVTFGTGQYLTAADTETNTAGGFYAVSDNGYYGLKKNNLEARSITASDVPQALGTAATQRTLIGDEIDWSSEYGWYIQLNQGSYPTGDVAGERVVNRAILLRDVLFFNTLIPSAEACSAGGHGWLMSVDVRTGLAPQKFAVFDSNGDGNIDDNDLGAVGQYIDGSIPNKSDFLDGKKQYIPTSSGEVVSRDVNLGKSGREGRLAWEELVPF